MLNFLFVVVGLFGGVWVGLHLTQEYWAPFLISPVAGIKPENIEFVKVAVPALAAVLAALVGGTAAVVVPRITGGENRRTERLKRTLESEKNEVDRKLANLTQLESSFASYRAEIGDLAAGKFDKAKVNALQKKLRELQSTLPPKTLLFVEALKVVQLGLYLKENAERKHTTADSRKKLWAAEIDGKPAGRQFGEQAELVVRLIQEERDRLGRLE